MLLFIVGMIKMCNDQTVGGYTFYQEILKAEIRPVVTYKQTIERGPRTLCQITWHDFQRQEYKTLDGCSQLFSSVEVGDTLEKGTNQMTFVVKNASKHPDLEVLFK